MTNLRQAIPRLTSEPEHILHVVKARRLQERPMSRVQRTAGKRFPAARSMRQLQPLASSGKNHGVFPDNISGANRLRPGFTVAPYFVQDFEEPFRSSTGRVLLRSVMHFDHIQIEFFA